MEKTAKRPFYKRDPITTILLTLGIFLSSQIIAALLISLYPAFRNWTESEATLWLESSVSAQFVYVVIAEALAISMVWQLVKRLKLLPERLGFVPLRVKDLGYAAVSYAVYFVLYLLVITTASNLVPGLNLEQEQQTGFETAFGTMEVLMTFVSLVILPPVAEEIIFRGYLYTSLRAKYTFLPAVIVTSLLFGAAHLQFGSGAPLLWVAAIDTFILSVILCFLRERRGSLWPAILLHAIKNVVAFVILFGSRI